MLQCYGEATKKNQYACTIEELQGVYVGIHVKQNATDLKKMVRTMADPTFVPPDNLDATSTDTEMTIWKAKVNMFVKCKDTYHKNKCVLYSIIWSLCSEAMQAKIKSVNNYEDVYNKNDSLLLLAEIKGILYKFKSQKNIYIALDIAKSNFYSSCQGHSKTNAEYMTRFQDSVAVIEHYGGSIGDNGVLYRKELRKIGITQAQASPEQTTTCTACAIEKAHAIAFLQRADAARYLPLTTNLENQFTHGNNQYPTTVTDTYNMLVNFKRPGHEQPRNRNVHTPWSNSPTSQNTTRPGPAQQTEIAFAQTGAPPPIETVQCYNCQAMGHY